MPTPALSTKFGCGCQAKPRRGAKLFFFGFHSGVPRGAMVAVERSLTSSTVYGGVPFGDEGAVLCSHIISQENLRFIALLYVSCSNGLELESTIWTSALR